MRVLYAVKYMTRLSAIAAAVYISINTLTEEERNKCVAWDSCHALADNK